MCSGADLNRDLIEMELHGFAVAGWQHQRGSRPKLGTDRTEQIGRLGALIVTGARARALSGPAIGQLVLLVTRISSWHHTSIGVPGASLARTSATRAGKFF